jgi:hypothetical protein
MYSFETRRPEGGVCFVLRLWLSIFVAFSKASPGLWVFVRLEGTIACNQI